MDSSSYKIDLACGWPIYQLYIYGRMHWLPRSLFD